MIEVDTYLVRHGEYTECGELSQAGRVQSEGAARTLFEYALGGTALILSSDAPRAMETAEIIAQRLGVDGVVPSRRINVGGNDEDVIRDLDQWVHTALFEADTSLEGRDALVVVTHASLIRQAQISMGRSSSTPGHGQVVKYSPGSWQKSDLFSPQRAALAEENIKRGR